MSFRPNPSIIRIGGVFIFISATIFWWVSLSHKSETRFWNIGSYTIASVSARDDNSDSEWDNDNSDSEWDNGQYTFVDSPSTSTAGKSVHTPLIQPKIASLSFDEKTLQVLKLLGFSSEEAKSIQNQFQWLYSDIVSRYPTTSWRISVLQQLIRQAEVKITDIQSLSEENSSEVFSSKERSLKALNVLAGLCIDILQSSSMGATSNTISPQSSVVAASQKPTISNSNTAISAPVRKVSTPVKPTPVKAPVPVKPTPVIQPSVVIQTPTPMVRTRTRAS